MDKRFIHFTNAETGERFSVPKIAITALKEKKHCIIVTELLPKLGGSVDHNVSGSYDEIARQLEFEREDIGLSVRQRLYWKEVIHIVSDIAIEFLRSRNPQENVPQPEEE